MNLGSNEDKKSLKIVDQFTRQMSQVIPADMLMRDVRHYFNKSTKGYNMALWPSLIYAKVNPRVSSPQLHVKNSNAISNNLSCLPLSTPHPY
jgi:hypothetical protein